MAALCPEMLAFDPVELPATQWWDIFFSASGVGLLQWENDHVQLESDT
jgi:hypothetical protein